MATELICGLSVADGCDHIPAHRYQPPVSSRSFSKRLCASICFGGLAVTITAGRGVDVSGFALLGFGLRA